LDNLTHTLTGLTLARAGLGRRTRWALPVLLLASNAPDIDIVTAFTGGQLEYLEAHRGATHGPLGIVGLGLLCVACVLPWWVARRRRSSDWEGSQVRLSWWRLTGVAIAGVAAHVLMDLPTVYGTRILSPFISTWYSLDWMPIIDVYLWLVLLGGLVASRVTRVGATRAARVVLVLLVLDYAARGVLQHRAVAAAAAFDATGGAAPCADAPVLTRHPSVIEARLAGPGSCIRAAALPTFFSPFTWRTVRQYPDGYELSDRQVFSPGAPVQSVWMGSESGPLVARARATRTARVFLDFSRFPAASVRRLDDGGARVGIVDVRFVGHPLRLEADPAAYAPFVVSIELDGSGSVVEQRLGN